MTTRLNEWTQALVTLKTLTASSLVLVGFSLTACDHRPPAIAATAVTAAPHGLAQAIRDMDVAILTNWQGRSGATPSEVALAQAAVASLGRNEDVAAAQLVNATNDPALSSELHRYAGLMLFNVRFRQGRYGDALKAIDAALSLGADSDPVRAASDLQGRSFAAALADAPSMQASALLPGELPVVRDGLSLPRAEVAINGVRETAVLDTGASFPAIVESRVRRAGLRMLGTTAEGRSNSRSAMQFRLAIADTLSIGGMEFKDVVFTVVPDSALRFGGGKYTINAIIGLPILLEMGRLEFHDREGKLHYGPSPHAPGVDSNLLLNGTRPLILVRADGADGPLQMMLDTGSNKTNITGQAAADYPSLMVDAEARTVTVGGAGGETREKIRVIPSLNMSVQGFRVPLRDVWVRSTGIGGRHGIMGHDILGAGAGYVVDFQAMRFELLP